LRSQQFEFRLGSTNKSVFAFVLLLIQHPIALLMYHCAFGLNPALMVWSVQLFWTKRSHYLLVNNYLLIAVTYCAKDAGRFEREDLTPIFRWLETSDTDTNAIFKQWG